MCLPVRSHSTDFFAILSPVSNLETDSDGCFGGIHRMSNAAAAVPRYGVVRQHSSDRMGRLRQRGFLAHRSPLKSNDETIEQARTG